MKIILYVYIYMCVCMCVCVDMRTRGHTWNWNPAGWTQRGLSPKGGGSQFDMINHVQQEGPKTSSTWKIMEAANSLLKQIRLQLAS